MDSALVWGTRGRRFKSDRPDRIDIWVCAPSRRPPRPLVPQTRGPGLKATHGPGMQRLAERGGGRCIASDGGPSRTKLVLNSPDFLGSAGGRGPMLSQVCSDSLAIEPHRRRTTAVNL